jgi:hypothetical protein
MRELDLAQLNVLQACRTPDDVTKFRNSGALRFRALAPIGLEDGAAVEGILTIHRGLELAWFDTDEDERQGDQKARGCVWPARIALWSWLIALIAAMFFYDHCGGWFDPDEPACSGSTIWSFPLFTFPFAIFCLAFAWGLFLFLFRTRSGPTATVELPKELWTVLNSFEDSIKKAKSGQKAPMPEQIVEFGVRKAAKKVGEAISGPMIGGALEIFADEFGEKEARIAAAMDIVHAHMIESVERYCGHAQRPSPQEPDGSQPKLYGP